MISAAPAALQLRYLQTLSEIGAEQNSTIVFPLPIDLLTPLPRRPRRVASESATSGRRAGQRRAARGRRPWRCGAARGRARAS